MKDESEFFMVIMDIYLNLKTLRFSVNHRNLY